jgi:hypothetical protein
MIEVLKRVKKEIRPKNPTKILFYINNVELCDMDSEILLKFR